MADSLPILDIAASQLVIVAEGDSPGAQSNARGHLFENFIARLFKPWVAKHPQRVHSMLSRMATNSM